MVLSEHGASYPSPWTFYKCNMCPKLERKKKNLFCNRVCIDKEQWYHSSTDLGKNPPRSVFLLLRRVLRSVFVAELHIFPRHLAAIAACVQQIASVFQVSTSVKCVGKTPLSHNISVNYYSALSSTLFIYFNAINI